MKKLLKVSNETTSGLAQLVKRLLPSLWSLV